MSLVMCPEGPAWTLNKYPDSYWRFINYFKNAHYRLTQLKGSNLGLKEICLKLFHESTDPTEHETIGQSGYFEDFLNVLDSRLCDETLPEATKVVYSLFGIDKLSNPYKSIIDDIFGEINSAIALRWSLHDNSEIPAYQFLDDYAVLLNIIVEVT